MRGSPAVLLLVLAVGLASLGAVASATGAAPSMKSGPSGRDCALALCPGSGAATDSHAPCGFLRPHSPRVAYRHVITILMENHSFDQISGTSPYLNGLAAACGLADNYFALMHPSHPNYIAITSGDTAGLTRNCDHCSFSIDSIFSQVGPKGWRSYIEALPSIGFTGGGVGTYEKHHNPAVFYTNIASAYAVNDVPLGTPTSGALISDLRTNKLPRYSFIAPDECNDEDACDVPVGDAWLARWIPLILSSQAYRGGGTALFITYDEGSHIDNHVYTVVVSPYTPKGTVSHVAFNHYSVLKTQESLLGLGCLGHACDPGTVSMRTAFGL